MRKSGWRRRRPGGCWAIRPTTRCWLVDVGLRPLSPKGHAPAVQRNLLAVGLTAGTWVGRRLTARYHARDHHAARYAIAVPGRDAPARLSVPADFAHVFSRRHAAAGRGAVKTPRYPRPTRVRRRERHGWRRTANGGEIDGIRFLLRSWSRLQPTVLAKISTKTHSLAITVGR